MTTSPSPGIDAAAYSGTMRPIEPLLRGMDLDTLQRELEAHATRPPPRPVAAAMVEFWSDCAAYLHMSFIHADLEPQPPVRGRREALTLLQTLERHLLSSAAIVARFRTTAVHARMTAEIDQMEFHDAATRLERAIAAAHLPEDLAREAVRHSVPLRDYPLGSTTVLGDYRPGALVAGAEAAASLALDIEKGELFHKDRSAGQRSDWLTARLISSAAVLFEEVTGRKPTAHISEGRDPDPSRFLAFLHSLWREFARTVHAPCLPPPPKVRFVQKALKK
ncbi:hypothetical protein [Sphingomonas sp. M1-B02]|uniref:hypothetical protein n=1 Tax=Sphingomonas sp. M1-B02 TaxID=3114300 RepID=UPI00223F351D|nr:hypothetical protein [Sphingomonas sp. S6-11]UZK67849.1 hypothetical protein OKW87_08525 [Sphingomonas sp. S6-11]